MRETALPVLLGFAMMTVPLGTWASDQGTAEQRRAISELTGKEFLVTTNNGKKSISVLSPDQGKELAFKGYGKPCVENVARLNIHPGKAATVVEGTPLILAFLDCPANNNGGAGSIVALFDYQNTDVPLCHTYVNLMDKSEYYYGGLVSSLALRKISENDFFVAVTLSGGDAGDAWTSYAFLHMNSKCQVTPVAKFYASTHVDVLNEEICQGSTINYRFLEGSKIEIETKKLVCAGKEYKYELIGTKKFDLSAMLQDPKRRIFDTK